jgi:hypothetical protein
MFMLVVVGTKAWGVMLPPPLHGHNTSVWNRWVDVDDEVGVGGGGCSGCCGIGVAVVAVLMLVLVVVAFAIITV